MTYRFKVLQELTWVGIVAVGLVLLEMAVAFDFEEVQDWRTWAVGLAGSCIRAAAAAVLTRLRPA